MIGGGGADRLESKGGENLLISGSTAFDDDLESLNFIMNEWTSNRAYTRRIENIRNGEGATHGVALIADHTVFDDADKDLVRGGTQDDWFFANSEVDRLWRAADEVLDDLAQTD